MKDRVKTKQQLIEELDGLRRESTVETALDRVRVRALGMQESQEISDVAQEIFTELNNMNIDVTTAGIDVWDVPTDHLSLWTYTGETPKTFDLSYSAFVEALPPGLQSAFTATEAPVVYSAEGATLVDDMRSLCLAVGLPEDRIEHRIRGLPDRLTWQAFRFSETGQLGLWTQDLLTDVDQDVCQRFADAFGFAYARFQELEQKEKQNRELTIQNALERVRAQALGMQQSADILAVTDLLYREFQDLGFPLRSASIHLADEEADTNEVWVIRPSAGMRISIKVPLSPLLEIPAARNARAARANGAAHYTHVWTKAEFEDAMRLYYAATNLGDPEQIGIRFDDASIGHNIFFTHGDLFLWTAAAVSAADLDVATRFAEVFGFAYTRFLELQEKEAQVRQADRRAAVDRVRAEIATMRTAADLERVTPLLWEELTGLGVSFSRCGVFIVDDEAQRIDAYLTNPQGASLGALSLAFSSHAHVGRLVEHWRAQTPHTEQWDQPTFQRWVHFLQEQGQSIEPQQYLDAEAAPEALTLQFAPFVQGMLYVGSAAPLPEEDVVLVQELATAFSVAYARYLDFQRLEAQNFQIQEATRHKSEFLASMSHDLRTPMNAIIGYTRLLLRRTADRLDEREQRNLRNIATSSNNLLTLINEILDLSRIEAGRVDLHIQPVDLSQLADECADALAPIVQPGVELRREGAAVNPIQTDPNRLRQVLMNLLGNATKFTERGHITLSLHAVDHQVEIAVADTGVGIPPEDLPHIFEEFRQVGREGAEEQGSGLGLAIVKKSVELLGGTISVESKMGEGTKFTLRLTDYDEDKVE